MNNSPKADITSGQDYYKISFALSIDTVDEVSVKVDGETGGETTKESNISKLTARQREVYMLIKAYPQITFMEIENKISQNTYQISTNGKYVS